MMTRSFLRALRSFVRHVAAAALIVACLALPVHAKRVTLTTQFYGMTWDGRFGETIKTSPLDVELDLWRCGDKRGVRHGPPLERATVTLSDWALALGMEDLPMRDVPEAATELDALRVAFGHIHPNYPDAYYYVDGPDTYYLISVLLDEILIGATPLPPTSSLPDDCLVGDDGSVPRIVDNSGGQPPEQNGAAQPVGPGGPPVAAGGVGVDPSLVPISPEPVRPAEAPSAESDAAEPQTRVGPDGTELGPFVSFACQGSLAAPSQTGTLDDATMDWLLFRATCSQDRYEGAYIRALICGAGYVCVDSEATPLDAREMLGMSWGQVLAELTGLAGRP